MDRHDDRGYSVLAYEGPGQGQALRDGMRFTPEWEKPTAAVLDEFLRTHARPKQIVLIGMSMGGYFAPRAAAFQRRIDGVVVGRVLRLRRVRAPVHESGRRSSAVSRR